MLRRPPDDKEVLDLHEASQLLRLCSKTVAKLAVAGELPGRKVGRVWRFSRSALLRHVEQQSAPNEH